jgi:predicted HicB family RNase H-like nuclease
MMAKKKLLADCRTEAEEARWFEKNQDRLLEMFKAAEQSGMLRRSPQSVGIAIDRRTGEVARPPSQKVMLRIPTGDLERARALAAKKGIGYQTYMKSLLHEALDRESRKAV